MGILNSHITLFLGLPLTDVLFPVMSGDIIRCCGFRLCGDTGGIGSQIGNQRDGAFSLDIYALIQLLCETHRLGGGEIQAGCGHLLEGTCGKGKGRLLGALRRLYLADGKRSSLQIPQHCLHIRCAVQRGLFSVLTIIMGGQGPPAVFRGQLRVQGPVLFGNKGIDLLLPVADHAQCDRLHTSRGESALDLCP